MKRYTFTHYLFGALPARLGDNMSDQVLLLASLAVTGSIAAGSSVIAGLTLSAAIGGPILGTMLDRSARSPGRIMTVALGLYALGMGILAFSLGHVPLWLSVVIALLSGLFMPAISGGWSSRLKSFIPHRQLAKISTVDANTFNVSGLIAPGLAGLVAIAFGAYWAAFVLVALLLFALPTAWTLPRDATQTAHRTSFLHDTASGFSAILESRALLRATLVVAISYVGIGMLWVLFPLIGKEAFGKAGYGGLLSSIVSVGALVATMVYAKQARRRPDMITFLSTLVFGIAITMLYFASNALIAILAMLIAGLADGPQLAAMYDIRNRETPDRMRSEVFTTGESLRITAAAVGVEIAGLVANSSLSTALLIAGLLEVGAATVFLLITPGRSKARSLVIEPEEV